MKQKFLEGFEQFKDKLVDTFTDEKNINEQISFIETTLSTQVTNRLNTQLPVHSIYYHNTTNTNPNNINIFFIALVTFHQKQGSVVEYTFPSKQSLLEANKDIFTSLNTGNTNGTSETTLTNIFDQLSYYCLPDGVHSVECDNNYFIIQNYSKLWYCTSTYRQFQTDKNTVVIDDFQENIRDCVQKSLCIVSFTPFFNYYYKPINNAMSLYIQQKSLNDKAIIDSLYNEWNMLSCLDITLDNNVFNYKKWFNFLRNDIITLWKCILLRKKVIVFSQISSNVSFFILSLLNLIPHALSFDYKNNAYDKSKNQTGMPWKIFDETNKLFPLFSLFDMESMWKTGVDSYWIGTSNALVCQSKEMKCDWWVNLDIGKIVVNVPTSVNDRLINLSKNERKLYRRWCNVYKIKDDIYDIDSKRNLGNLEWILPEGNSSSSSSTSNDFNRKIKENHRFIEIVKVYFMEFFFDLSLCCLKQSNNSQHKTSDIQCHNILCKYHLDFIVSLIQIPYFQHWWRTHDISSMPYRSKHSPYCSNVSVVYDDWNTYFGGMKNGWYHGKGTWYNYKDKTTYIGNWRNNQRHGKGNYTTWDNTYLYEGDWVDNQIEGSGVLVTPSEKYNGEFKNNKYHGEGFLLSKNGDLYKGSFVNGMKSGFGTWNKINGDVYEGYFENDWYEGMGKLRKSDSSKEEGMFKAGMLSGNGLKIWTNSNIYLGVFKEGMLEGEGKIINKNGEVIEEGVYVKGKNVWQSQG